MRALSLLILSACGPGQLRGSGEQPKCQPKQCVFAGDGNNSWVIDGTGKIFRIEKDKLSFVTTLTDWDASKMFRDRSALTWSHKNGDATGISRFVYSEGSASVVTNVDNATIDFPPIPAPQRVWRATAPPLGSRARLLGDTYFANANTRVDVEMPFNGAWPLLADAATVYFNRGLRYDVQTSTFSHNMEAQDTGEVATFVGQDAGSIFAVGYSEAGMMNLWKIDKATMSQRKIARVPSTGASNGCVAETETALYFSSGANKTVVEITKADGNARTIQVGDALGCVTVDQSGLVGTGAENAIVRAALR